MAFNVTVGASNTAVLASNANRKRAWFRNLSTSGQIVYLRYGANATLNTGVRLNPNGGTWTTYNTGAVNAIATAAGAIVAGDEL